MTRLPSLTARKVIKMLSKDGFVFIRQRGSHRLYEKGNQMVTIPYHNKDLKRPTLKNIIEQSGLSEEEFIKLLKQKP